MEDGETVAESLDQTNVSFRRCPYSPDLQNLEVGWPLPLQRCLCLIAITDRTSAQLKLHNQTVKLTQKSYFANFISENNSSVLFTAIKSLINSEAPALV